MPGEAVYRFQPLHALEVGRFAFHSPLNFGPERHNRATQSADQASQFFQFEDCLKVRAIGPDQVKVAIEAPELDTIPNDLQHGGPAFQRPTARSHSPLLPGNITLRGDRRKGRIYWTFSRAESLSAEGTGP